MGKTIIVSNRLPVKLSDNEGEITLTPSEGGLATGLGSIYREKNNIWIGWPGMEISDEDAQRKVSRELDKQDLKPVFLTQEEINHYYEGFSNEILWPVFHYMPTYARYHQPYWDYYYSVNQKFRDAVLQNMEPGDIVWVHDYQLMLLPGMLRAVVPEATIGFFQHIPFPSYELFRMIPWRVELLDGLLGADLIGFHTFDDARHFVSAARRLTPVISSSNEISYNNRNIIVDSFPMGIDSQKFRELTNKPLVREYIAELNKSFENTRLILSIDRLDYSKGILQRLKAFELLLQLNPEYIGNIVLYMIVVPSRDNVRQYKELLDEIDKFVGGINARYRTMTWQPVFYFYRALPVEELSALYATAEICLVTPMRDGMNLVCKEFIASREHDDGVLILSEMAGASKELSDAIIVNPNNIHALMQAIEEALDMPLAEQKRRMQLMKEIVMKFNVSHWVKLFMARLKEVKQMQLSMFAKHISETSGNNIKHLYAHAESRLIFLDYDGTLVGFTADIEMAAPDEELYRILQKLAEDAANRVVIVSGRNPEFLEKWFGSLHIDMVAEHGAWTKIAHGEWQSLPGLSAQWKKDFFPVLESFTDRTPGAFIEEKDFSLVWHYRKVEESLGELRSNEIMSTLRYLAEDKGLQVLPGNKVVEVKNVEINKGKAALSFLQEGAYDFNMAIGDDHTDEDIFKAMPSPAVTIKVGSQVSAARYSINDYREVRKFLKFLAGNNLFNAPQDFAVREK
ncbi:MAG: bifunctional alpha,alpha-trehalose-phosphate synthase (UDP-forming)/trehalose-phosphatase [Chitinophagaceae bacterium]|nr:bifunctional alpha,alpha-trehalose-phosphate synthase (UDP-forming)/trehalose-phosphatase [Chitinophagaceae bacterium]